MNKYLLIALIVTLSACAQKMDNYEPIQDTQKAVHYFEDEMNFTLSPGGVKSAIAKHEHVVIVDVRAEKDFKAGHISGAVNIPYDKWHKFDGSESEFPGLIKDGFNYVYCYEMLCNLSQKACKKFASLGYPVKEMKGGFNAWKDHHYAIEKSKAS